MSDINAALLEIRKKQLAESGKTQQEVPVEAQTATPESTEEPIKSTTEEVPKEQPKAETTPTEKVEELVETDWDAERTEKPQEVPKSQEYDFHQIGNAIGWEDVKTKDQLIAKVSETLTKKKELEENQLSGIPDELKEVIEVTKSGANWKDYLSDQLIDYSKVDPIQLYEDEFFRDAVKNPRYLTNGKYDEAKAEEAFGAVPEVLREQFGTDIALDKASKQRQRQLDQRAKAEARIAKAEQTLSSATRELQDLLPFDNYGIKFGSKHSSEIYSGIASSKLTKKHLGIDYESLVKSGADMRAVARTVAAAEYAEDMIKHKSKNSKNAAAIEILEKTQNAQIKTPGSHAAPEDPEQKVLTPAEKIAKHLASQRKGL